MPRRTRRRPTEVQLHIRLYPGQDDELIRWLAQFDDQPYGVKTQAVKETLRRGLEGDSVYAPSAERTADLAEIRRIVEAAIETGLTRFEGRIATTVGNSPQGDDETEDLLDALGEVLVLKD